MSLAGKLSSEIGIHTPASRLFNFYTTQLHHIQNISDTVHGTKLHQGDEWHSYDSVKHWTYTVDGKVVTCHEIIESVDEQNKTITFKLFGESIDQHFKVFKLIFQTMDKNDGGATIKWTIEYEKINEDVEPPFGFLKFCIKCVKDVDGHLLKGDPQKP